MKKKTKLIIFILITLFTPFNIQTYKDGGTATYSALSYKFIVWHQLDDSPDGYYKTGTEIHFLPNNFHNLDYYFK